MLSIDKILMEIRSEEADRDSSSLLTTCTFLRTGFDRIDKEQTLFISSVAYYYLERVDLAMVAEQGALEWSVSCVVIPILTLSRGTLRPN